MASFIFGAPGLPKTPEELARRRQVAEALAARALGSHPTTIGDGLASIGNAIAARRINGRLDKAEAAGKESAAASFNPLIAALSGTGAMGAPTSASGTPQGQAIDNRVSQVFSEPSIPEGYFASIAGAESGGNDAAKNSRSSATGRYQFTTGTWDSLMRSRPELGLTADGRTDPAQQEKAIRAFTAENARALSGAGIPVNGGNLYAAHFLGAGDAKDVLSAPDGALVSAYVSPNVVKANPFLSQMSVGEFKQWAGGKVGKGLRLDAQPTSLPMPGADAQIAATDPRMQTGTTQTASLAPVAAPQAPALSAPQNVATPPAPPAQPMAQPGPDMRALSQQFGGSQQLAGADPRKGILTALLSGQQNGKAGFPAAPGQGGQNTMQAIMAAMSNPWLNEGQKAVVGALLKQEIAKNDPGNALDAEYKRAQIEHLQQPDEPKIVELFDEKTGQPYKARYDTKTGQYERVGGIKAQSNGITIGPDGTVQIGGNMKLTEGQSKDLNYFQRANAALPTIDKFGKTLTDLKETAAGSVPVVGNYLTSPEYQQAQQAGREFLAAVLRKDSGAAITAQEFDLYGPMFLPQPGDTPEVLAQKQAARERAVQAIQGGLGNAKPMSEQPVTQNPSTNPSEPVTINGYTIQEVQ